MVTLNFLVLLLLVILCSPGCLISKTLAQYEGDVLPIDDTESQRLNDLLLLKRHQIHTLILQEAGRDALIEYESSLPNIPLFSISTMYSQQTKDELFQLHQDMIPFMKSLSAYYQAKIEQHENYIRSYQESQ